MFSLKEIKNKLKQQLRCHESKFIFRELAIIIFCKSTINTPNKYDGLDYTMKMDKWTNGTYLTKDFLIIFILLETSKLTVNKCKNLNQ